jgi:predicted DsbA family dithiol-disulfide isomerase
MAVASEHVVADVVEVDALPELVREYKVTSVPKTLVNGSIELVGSQSESSLLDAIEAV